MNEDSPCLSHSASEASDLHDLYLLNRSWIRRTGVQHDGVWVAHGHGAIRRVKVLILKPLICDICVLVVPHGVWLVQDVLPVHPVGQDEDAGLSCLKQSVQQREHVHPPHQLRGEGQLQDGGAQLDVLTPGLQRDGPATVWWQVEEDSQAVTCSVAAQRHEDGHHVDGGGDSGQEFRSQHGTSEDEEQHQSDQ